MNVFSQAGPTATTEAATGIGGTIATVNGTVNANGSSTTVSFEYGLTEEYGQTAPAVPSPVTGSTGTPVAAALTGLDPSTTYHYRVVATNTGGTTNGADMTFTTTASTANFPIVTTDAASSIGADSATLNGRVNTRNVSGTVTFQWGTTTSYGNIATADQSPMTSTALDPVTASLTGLSNNTTYHYRVVASNINGTTYGMDMTFAIGSGGGVPTATTNAATGIGSITATLNGTANANGDSTAVTFEYGLDTNYGSLATAEQSPLTGSTLTAVSKAVTGLIPNTVYHFRVVATNSAGTDNGADMTFTTLPLAPTVTTDAASSVTAATATLNGTVNANGDSSAVTFEYGVDMSYGTTVTADQSPVTGSTGTAVSKAITGLIDGVTYHYRVAATNAGGTTYGADMTFTAGVPEPTATTGAASGIGATSATLNGTVNANNSSTTVTFEYGETTAYGRSVNATPGTVTGSTGTAVSASLSGLNANITYHYRVKAVSAGGTTYGADMTFATLAAPTVTTIGATSVTTSGATFNGTVNANGSSTAVTFEYGTDTSYGTTVTADQSPVTGSTPTAVSKAVTGLTINTTYHYRVVGQNSQGTVYGADMTVVTSAPAAPTLTTDAASRVLQDGAVLNGTVNANNADTAVTFEYGLDTNYGTTVTAVPSPVTGSADTAVSLAISGLTVNTLYHYRVVGTNTNGTSNGNDMTFTPTTFPLAVTEAATSVTATTATLHGTGNANYDTSTTLSFQYDSSPPAPNYSFSIAASPLTINGSSDIPATVTLTGLTPNTTYYYRIYAGNSLSEYTYGGQMTFTTLPADTPPTAVTVAASAVGATSATLNGTVNANNADTTVTFEYGLDTNYGGAAIADQSPLNGSTDTPVSNTLTSLAPNTTYHYRVVAQNTGNTVYGTDLTFTTGTLPPTADTNPATAVSGTGVTLNGIVNANNDSTTVTFEYGLTPAYGTTVTADQSPVTGNANTAVSKAITGLTNNTTYYYRVVAQNGSGTTNGTGMTFFTGSAPPTATTGAASSIGSTSATLNGVVNANNADTTVTFQYGETTGYGRTVTADQSPLTGSTDTAVSFTPTDLISNTTYHYRVVGQNASGTTNGSDMTFTTNVANSPAVTSVNVTNITAVSATVNGDVTDEGGAPVTARGICWSTSPAPTIADGTTVNGSGAGTFSGNLTGLSELTIYYARAYATSVYGTSYGDELQFTTPAVNLPSVTTANVTNITSSSAAGGGTVTDEGDAPVTARGVCWSTGPNPTIANNRTSNGTGAGSFTSSLTNLSANTMYYFRAYATNLFGTVYGAEYSFTTKSTVVNVSITQPDQGETVSGTVTIAASASVSNVARNNANLAAAPSIVKVEFYIDGGKIAEDSTQPYEIQWDSTTVADGGHTVKVMAYDQENNFASHEITVIVNNAAPPPPGGEITLNRTNLNYGALFMGGRTNSAAGSNTGGTVTGPQTFTITGSGGTIDWIISYDVDWISCTPDTGTGDAVVTVSVNPSGLATGAHVGHITVSDQNSANAAVLPVNLTVFDPWDTSAPFGTFETPVNNSTVEGSIPVTGWALDDIEVTAVEIYRSPVSGEGSGMVYIGNAVFVDGARPDVEAAYPDYPMNYRAGWGYMLLTYGLPKGDGVYTFYAKAVDAEGNTTMLGSKTITVANAESVKPFGAIDTPTQGGIASGKSFINFGWALTPQPNTIPIDGSTMTVWVDGVPIGNPVYNQYRSDVAALFPGYNNSNGAGGYFYLDTTGYSDGVHIISWSVKDDGGNRDGIGSRFFTIQNANGSRVEMKRQARPNMAVPTLAGGLLTIKELDRVAFRVDENHAVCRGFMEANDRIYPLPVGSTLDTENGIFYWQPGPGFRGMYTLSFVVVPNNGLPYKKSVVVNIENK